MTIIHRLLIALSVVLFSGCASTSLTERGLHIQGDASLVDYHGKFGALHIENLNHSTTNRIMGDNVRNAATAIGAAVATSGILGVIK